MQWLDLNPYWEICLRAAEARDGQKRKYASSAYWNKDSHFLGLLGEMVVGIELGLPVDLKLDKNGHPYPDLAGCLEVKACQYWNDPWLKERPSAAFHAKAYVLVALNLAAKQGGIAGWVLTHELKEAPLRDWGYGQMHSLPTTALLSREKLLELAS